MFFLVRLKTFRICLVQVPTVQVSQEVCLRAYPHPMSSALVAKLMACLLGMANGKHCLNLERQEEMRIRVWLLLSEDQ